VQVSETAGAEPRRSKLDELLGVCARALPALADELNHAYLVHAVPKRQRGGALS
jgi:hypothetical protein